MVTSFKVDDHIIFFSTKKFPQKQKNNILKLLYSILIQYLKQNIFVRKLKPVYHLNIIQMYYVKY